MARPELRTRVRPTWKRRRYNKRRRTYTRIPASMRPENKYLEGTLNSVVNSTNLSTTTGGTEFTALIGQGYNIGQRTGNKVFLKYLYLDGVINASNYNANSTFRWAIIMQTRTGVLTFTLNTAFNHKSNDYIQRVYRDKYFMNEVNDSKHYIKWFIPIYKMISYDPSSATLSANPMLHSYIISDVAAGINPYVYGIYRLVYTDA